METLFLFVYVPHISFHAALFLIFNLNLRGTLFHACENPTCVPFVSVRSYYLLF